MQTFETGYRSTLSAKFNPTDTEIIVANAPTVTAGRMHVYRGNTHAWIKYTGVSGSSLTGVTFVSQTADPATSVTGTTFPAGTSIELVEMHDQMLDKQNGGTIVGPVTFSSDVTANKSFRYPVYADATARDLAITSPTNGMWIYNTALGVNQQYIGGAWTNNATGSVVNADTATAGKVEIATQAEFDAGTDVGGTGATLVAPPSVIKTISGLSEMAGEAIAIRDSVFLETVTPFAIATSQQPISYSTLNTRIEFPVFGNGVATTAFKLALKKTGTPAQNLNFRIETDSAGSPSGTLFHANGTSAITAASLTTSFVDTTVALTGSITVPLGTKVWIVGFSGTYGSESLSSSNYYSVGVNANAEIASIYKTTRYNGTTHTSTPVTQTATWTGETSVGVFSSTTVNYTAISTCKITQLIKSSNTSTALSPTCTITQGTKTVTATFATHTATFSSPIILTPGAFTVTLTYPANSNCYESTANGTTSDLLVVTSGSAVVRDIRSITAVELLPISYISSTGFQLSSLAKTDSTLGYKLGFVPRISIGTYTEGSIAFTSVTGPITYPGLTEGSIYYASTAGLLSTTPGTVKMPVGIASGGKLNIGRFDTGIVQQLSVGISTTSPSFYHHGLSVTIVTTAGTVQTQTSPDNITWSNFFNITNVGTMTLNIPQGYVRVITDASGVCTIYN